ncbi:MAG: DUF362 domain-containing protein [Planctomycetota bacterium]|jgi:uncharacterized protein (DUF362 family)
MTQESSQNKPGKINRRNFLKTASISVAAGIGTILVGKKIIQAIRAKNATFIANVKDYNENLRQYILDGLKELQITEQEISDRTILLKPNLVEPHLGVGHINTHPLMVRAAIEAFLHLGAGSVIVAEGSGHRRDSHLILEEAGFWDILQEDKTPFIDLNTAEVTILKNQGRYTNLKELLIPKIVVEADIIVSLAKMKTHHWASATLAMKNMFGIMPGLYYGWPKNVLHQVGIQEAILDINSTVKADLAIIDGIVGMQGDGPIMGDPIESNVIVMGRNLPAVDATCARIMAINPNRIGYMRLASRKLGEINKNFIEQRGETIASVRREFKLLEMIPAHRGIRL